MDSTDVAEIKKYVGVVAEGLQAQIQDVKTLVGVVAQGLRGEIREVRRHAGVVAESLGGQIRLVAEAVSAVDSKIDREVGAHREETRAEFAEVKAMIRFSHADLDTRVRRLEAERK